MKIVQSCWSCNTPDFLQHPAGWISPEYHLMSWALSCLQLKTHSKRVVLYTDSKAARVLIDNLRLPYDEVVCDLDELNRYDPKLWAIAKISTYGKQTEPFLHVDSDVFVWAEFGKDLMKSPLIAQNLEISTAYYEAAMVMLENNLQYFPDAIKNTRKAESVIYAYNAGILGGTRVDFFQEYAHQAFEFVKKNKTMLPKIDAGTFNIFFEQYLFYCLAREKDIAVNVLINDIVEDNGYTGLDDFLEVPHGKKYLHLLGTYKRHKIVCDQMAARLRNDFPDFYYRIISLFKKTSSPLERSYYYTIPEVSEKDLVSKFYRTKKSFEKNVFAKQPTSTGKLIAPFRIVDRISELIRVRWHDYRNIEHLLTDAAAFENTVNKIVVEKFTSYCDDYLYGRDICNAEYPDLISQMQQGFASFRLRTDPAVELIQSKFDWSGFSSANVPLNFNEINQTGSVGQISTAVIPEIAPQGYSMANVDELDIYLMRCLHSPKTITQILSDCRKVFDSQEIEESEIDYQSLMLGRIKSGIISKMLLVLKDHHPNENAPVRENSFGQTKETCPF